jgi:hypothetical protein
MTGVFHLHDPWAIESDGEAAVGEDELVRVFVSLPFALVLLAHHAPDGKIIEIHLIPEVTTRLDCTLH